jgi:hypothetical protein
MGERASSGDRTLPLRLAAPRRAAGRLFTNRNSVTSLWFHQFEVGK